MEVDLDIVELAVAREQKALSEYESKLLLAKYGIPITREALATSRDEAVDVASKLGYPVVLKGCSAEATHKTEMNLIRLNLANAAEVAKAYDDIAEHSPVKLDGILVQEMIRGDRELVIGLIRDPQFGPCVMLGLGGIFTELIKDVTFRVAPLEERDAYEMMSELKGAAILGPFRGKPPVDRAVLCQALIAMGQIGLENEDVAEIDVNPLIIAGDKPVAVDALVILKRERPE
jgi:acetyl-CoA synthetase (ADP-forming)